MMNKRISAIALLAIGTSLATIGCSKNDKTEKPVEENKVESTEKEETVITTKHIEKTAFKDLNELKTFTKQSTSDFSNFLNTNNIKNIIAPDGSITVNENMFYEKYTKNYKQLAYTQVESNYNDGIGYLKSGIKLNFHIEETLSTSNNFVKAIFQIISTYNPTITEERFNEELKTATSNSENTSEHQFNIGINGMNLTIITNQDNNERSIILSIRQELEFPKSNEVIKEYKTVKEFKEYGENMPVNVSDKITKLNEQLNKIYSISCKNIEMKLNSASVNSNDDFKEIVELEYNAENIDSIPKEVLTGLYDIIKDIMPEKELSNTLSFDEFKNYVESLFIYTGLKTSDSLIDEAGEYIMPNSLPLFDGLIDLNIDFKEHSNSNESNEDTKDEDNVENKEENKDNTNKTSKKYDTYIKLTINVPVIAEGVRKI